MPPKPPTAPPNPDLDALLTYTTRTQTLLTQLLTTISHPNPSTTPLSPVQRPLNPLAILRDSAKLLHAHTTKLSLMLTNKPFGAKSLTSELRACVEQCIMGMLGAIDIMACPSSAPSAHESPPGVQGSQGLEGGSIWGTTMLRESRARVARVIREMLVLTQELRALTETQAGLTIATNTATSRDSLSSTGVVWAACDALVELEKMGVPGLAVLKATQYQQTLKDALAELKEWAADVDDSDEANERDDGGFSDDEEDVFGASKRLPANDAELRAQVEATTKKLSLISMLYAALLKRRLRPFPSARITSSPNTPDEAFLQHTSTLDAILTEIRLIPDEVDELAGALYELDGSTAEARLRQCVDMAGRAAELARLSWEGREDEFTSWSAKWRESVGA